MEHKTSPGVKVLAVLAALIVIPGGAFLAIKAVPTGGKVAIAAGVVWWVVMSSLLGKFVLKQNPGIKTPVRAALVVAAVASIATAYVVTRGNTVDEDIVTAAPMSQTPSPEEREAALGGDDETSDSRPQTSEEEGETKPEKAAKKKAPAEEEAEPEPEPAKRKAAPAQNTQLLAGTFKGESGHRGAGKATVIKLAKGGRVVTFSKFDVDPGAGDLRVYLHEGKSDSDELGKFVEIAKLKGNKGDQQYEIPSDVNLKRFNSVVIWCVPFSTRIAQAPLA